jgi:hypothetical protein
MLVAMGAFFAITYALWPSWYPLEPFLYWFAPDSWVAVASTAWPLLAWGFGITALTKFATKNDPAYNRVAGEIVGHNMATSVQAGVFEELYFRWIKFYVAMPILAFLDWLLFGWDGEGWMHWLYVDVLLPVADWATLHKMHEYLVVVDGLWLIPAAIIAANASFRDGHKPSDEDMAGMTVPAKLAVTLIPMINSWYAGMILFYIMFTQGLLAAIAVHVTYDVLIFATIYLDACIERRNHR